LNIMSFYYVIIISIVIVFTFTITIKSLYSTLLYYITRGAHYDVILRFEHRLVWAPLLLDYLHPFGTSQQEKVLQEIALGGHWSSRRKGADDWEVVEEACRIDGIIYMRVSVNHNIDS